MDDPESKRRSGGVGGGGERRGEHEKLLGREESEGLADSRDRDEHIEEAEWEKRERSGNDGRVKGLACDRVVAASAVVLCW